MTISNAVKMAKKLTWNTAVKLGFRPMNESERVDRLVARLHPGMSLEILTKNEHWSEFLALLNGKNQQALNKLSAESLSENDRIKANAKRSLIFEIIEEVDREISKAKKAKTELDQIKESQK